MRSLTWNTGSVNPLLQVYKSNGMLKTVIEKIKSVFSASSSNNYFGKIKFLNYSRGYGFIDTEDVERDVFVHFKDLDKKINSGDKVAFEIVQEEKGPRAVNVSLVNS